MGFFDLLNPDERRWRNEAKQEAREYRQEAKEILSDAKDLYDDYKELKSDTQRVANKLSDFIRSYNSYKADLLKDLGGDINNTIENFKRFNISSRVISVPKIGDSYAPTVSVFSASNFMPDVSLNPISLILSSLSDPYKDRDRAIDERDKARDYFYKVQDAYSELKILFESLNGTKKFIESDRENLTQLAEKIRSLVGQLKNAMNRSSFTENEARYMTGISKIAELIKNSLEQRIADNSGNVEGNYRQYSDKLKSINNLIPAAPKIENSSTWLDRIINY